MTKQEAFDNIFHNHGGRFHYENTPLNGMFEFVKLHSLDIIRHLKGTYFKLNDVYVDFIDSTVCNAVVSKKDGDYYIGINAGAVMLLWDMYHKMLASPTVLNGIGNPKIENTEKKTLNAEYTNLGISFSNYGEGANPVDKDRRTFAQLSLKDGIQYLIYHECCHIVRGHLDFLINNSSFKTWNEFNHNTEQLNNGFRSIDSQTLEMDADSFAINRAFIFYHQAIEEFKNTDSEKWFKDVSSCAYRWAFSIYSFFRLINNREYTVAQMESLSHPPANVRIALLLGNLATLFSERYDQSIQDEVCKAAVAACLEAEKAFGEITYQTNNFNSMREAFLNPNIVDYERKVRSNWDNIRPSLEPYALGDLPPYRRDLPEDKR